MRMKQSHKETMTHGTACDRAWPAGRGYKCAQPVSQYQAAGKKNGRRKGRPFSFSLPLRLKLKCRQGQSASIYLNIALMSSVRLLIATLKSSALMAWLLLSKVLPNTLRTTFIIGRPVAASTTSASKYSSVF